MERAILKEWYLETDSGSFLKSIKYKVIVSTMVSKSKIKKKLLLSVDS